MADISRETTLDPVFAGTLTCLQYRQGYRFNQDSVLLANFAQPDPGERVLDLGTGCGIIGLVLAHRHPSLSLVGLEIQHDLVLLARQNADKNGFAARMEIVEGDLNDESILAPESFERIVCNPPYTDPEKSRRPAVDEIAIARQGLFAGPEELAAAACRLLVDRGRIDLIYPANRIGYLVMALLRAGLVPVKQRPVCNHPGAVEMLVMIEAEKNCDRNLEILPPFFIRLQEDGEYSPEMQKYYEP